MPETPFFLHLTGAAAALASALMWAIAAILFRHLGESMSATALNFIKGVVALACIGLLLLMSGFSDIDPGSYLYLALSGLLGICIGDTLYFLTLVRLGPRLTLLLGSLIPVTTAVIAVVVLHEQITFTAWCGILLTIAGVTYVLWERTAQSERLLEWRKGLLFGVLFVLANAAGIILTKVGVEDVPAMDATFVRTLWAVAGLTFWGLMVREIVPWIRPLQKPRVLRVMTGAAFIGAFLGTWLSVAALKLTFASVAAALNSTSPLFILPLSVWLLKEHVSRRAVSGAIVAVSGIGLYFMNIT
jgi:drug/metabolite transporter (DMT)-like permease